VCKTCTRTVYLLNPHAHTNTDSTRYPACDDAVNCIIFYPINRKTYILAFIVSAHVRKLSTWLPHFLLLK